MVILIMLLQLVEHQIGWRTLVATWRALSPEYALLVFTLMAVSHLLRALRIHLLLKQTTTSHYPHAIKISAVHQFFNNVLPMRIGEASFPLLMKRYYGTSIGQSISQLVLLRVLDLMFMGVITFLVIALLKPVLWLIMPLGLLALFTLALWFYRHNKHHQALPPLISNVRWLGKAVELIIAQAPKTPNQHLTLFAITAVAWTFKIGAACTAITLLSPLPVVSAMTAAVTVELSSILPINGIGGAGSFEAAFFAGASLAEGVQINWLGAAVNTHLFLLTCTVIVALLSLPIQIKKPQLALLDHDF